jgi:uncharacterized membrane protein
MLVCMYAGIMIYMLTPFSRAAVEIISPLISQVSLLDTGIVIDDATYALLVKAMLPAFGICGILALAVGGPIYYSYRMVEYVVIDKPGMGALMALRESKQMMRGNRLQMLKLDVSLWWYYLPVVASAVLCYGDVLLPMCGVELPVSSTVAYFVFYGLYLAASFAVHFFLRNRAEMTYIRFYEALRPEEPPRQGVVLGNIFQM